jgi:hypothetical protein
LRGKKVSFGPAGSASSLTGTIVFQRLGVQVEQVLYDNPTALQKLKTGELAALVRVIGKPIDFFAKIPENSGLHFVPIPFSNTFADYYTVGELTSTAYPALVPAGQSVDTIAAPAVLAVFNWSHREICRAPVLELGPVSRAAAPPQMARRQPCSDRSRLEPLECCGRDVTAYAPKGHRGSASRWQRVFCFLEG